jgi:mono/diheme cytochrome c family protein
MKFLPSRFELLSVIALPVGVALALQGGLTSNRPAAAARATPIHQDVSYAQDVVPILEARCWSCHGGVNPATGEPKIEKGLDMTTYDALMKGSEYGPIIEPGGPDDSLMLEMIASGDMPKIGDMLRPQEIELIRNWIQEGAPNN